MEILLTKRPPHKFHLAITGMILAAIFNASMGACAKLASPYLSTTAIVFWRNFIALFLFFPWVLWLPPRGHFKEKIQVAHWKMVLIRTGCGLISIFLFFFSLKSLPLSDAVLLFNTMPIFVPFVSYMWVRAPIFHRLWWGIGCAFVGISIILQPGMAIFNMASLLALGSGVFGAGAMVSLRLSNYSEPPYRIIFLFFVIASFVMGIATLFQFDESWHKITLPQAATVFGVAFFGLLYQIFVTWAAKHGPMRMISSFLFVGVVFSAFLDYWIWSTTLPMTFYIGLACIALGTTLITLLYPKKDQ